MTAWTSRLLAPIGAGLLLLGAAACSGDTTLPEDDPASAADPQLAYVQCLREHGLDVPDPAADGSISIDAEGVSPDQLEAAEAACSGLEQQAFGSGGDAELTEDEKQRILDMVACMRERGYDMPDPAFNGGVTTEQESGGGSGSGGGAGPEPDDPAFQADAAECAAEAGVEGPSLSGSGT